MSPTRPMKPQRFKFPEPFPGQDDVTYKRLHALEAQLAKLKNTYEEELPKLFEEWKPGAQAWNDYCDQAIAELKEWEKRYNPARTASQFTRSGRSKQVNLHWMHELYSNFEKVEILTPEQYKSVSDRTFRNAASRFNNEIGKIRHEKEKLEEATKEKLFLSKASIALGVPCSDIDEVWELVEDKIPVFGLQCAMALYRYNPDGDGDAVSRAASRALSANQIAEVVFDQIDAIAEEVSGERDSRAFNGFDFSTHAHEAAKPLNLEEVVTYLFERLYDRY